MSPFRPASVSSIKYAPCAERFDNVFCSVGTHPHNAHEELDIPLERIVELAQHPKVVAIGEAGLDYYYKHSTPEAQAEGFRRHIAAARETGLPLEIHTREADDDTIAILEDEHAKGAFPAVLHCFTGGRELAMRALALGLYVSFSGVLTFKKSDAFAISPAMCRLTDYSSKPTRRSWHQIHSAANATSRPMLPARPPYWRA